MWPAIKLLPCSTSIKATVSLRRKACCAGWLSTRTARPCRAWASAAADYSADGHLSIFRTNFSDEFETLYRNHGDGNFDEATLDAGLGQNTRYVGWGTGFFDLDNDGWKDLLLVNGHVFPEIDKLHIDIHYKDHAILYQNLANGKFKDTSTSAGPAFAELHSSRGAAFGDIDNDGAIEIAVNNQNEAPSLLKQSSNPPGHWVILKLEGTHSNRSAIGAKLKISTGGHTQVDEVRSGGSYLSQNDLRLHFGLGASTHHQPDRNRLALRGQADSERSAGRSRLGHNGTEIKKPLQME